MPADTLNLPVSDIILVFRDHGKPMLSHPHSTIDFSTSYAHFYWVFAVYQKGTIGIDIEEIVDNPHILDIAKRFLLPMNIIFSKTLK